MGEKRKLKLSPLEGNIDAYLQIETLESGDMYVTMLGQDTEGVSHCISAQIPNPINGGGNLDDYKILGKIYDILKKYQKSK